MCHMPTTHPRLRSAHSQVKLYSVAATAEALGCSKMHVYRQIAAGLLPTVDIGTPGAGRSKTRIRSDDLADYIDRNTRSPRKPAPAA